MTSCNSGIDWAAQPEPWCWIGPQFRRQCNDIIAEVIQPPLKQLIREKRKALGMTQQQLANAIGAWSSDISDFEMQGRGLTQPRLAQACELLGIEWPIPKADQ